MRLWGVFSGVLSRWWFCQNCHSFFSAIFWSFIFEIYLYPFKQLTISTNVLKILYEETNFQNIRSIASK